MIGLKRRKKRIFHRGNGRILLVPMDHGMTLGKIRGLEDIRIAVKTVMDAGADGVVLHKGMVKQAIDLIRPYTSLFVHVSASTVLGETTGHKVSVCSVEEAIRLGADAVSAHINLGDRTEPEQLREIGRISDQCQKWDMPFLLMAYPRGPKIDNEFQAEKVAHAVRVAAELGADFVKTNYTGDPVTFRQAITGSNIPVLIAGGSMSGETLLMAVKDALEAGAAGISVGRGIFGSENPVEIIKQLSQLIHGKHEHGNISHYVQL